MTAHPHRTRRASLLRWLIFAALLLTAAFFCLERNITQVALSLADARARALAVQALNQAAEELVQQGIGYDQLMDVSTDAQGHVRLIQANTAAMNHLSAQASLIAQEKLVQIENQYISVPLGAALGMTIFAGAGPKLRVQMLPVGAVSARFETEFEAAGINQTRHRVFLTLTASVQLVIPTGASKVTAQSQVAVAESIIVGQVPDSFVDVNDTSDILDLVP